MRQAKPKPQPSSPWDSQIRLLLWLATCVSLLSFLFYFQRSEVLLYGDAVAHVNIARRVFDSKTPGLLQLGTVWLPLPHLLMIPFLVSDRMWRTGAGGSIPSLIAYVLGAVALFRLVRGSLGGGAEPDRAAPFAAWIAALIYAANPNLIYMQSTAMGEALYLAFFIWAVVYFSEAMAGDPKALTKCGVCLAAACLTRYDGWFLALTMSAAVVTARIIAARRRALSGSTPVLWRPPAAKFVLIAAAAPVLWLAYNGAVYGNPLEFENGPYSAQAIERRTQTAGNSGHPGSGNLALAGLYFVNSAEENVAPNHWCERLWLLLGAVGVAAAAGKLRKAKKTAASTAAIPLMFLLAPLPFYALSVAYGGVPIFVPAFWPFTHYNVRYGLQLLPAFAVAVALVVYFVLRSAKGHPRLRLAVVLSLLALLIASYVSIWSAGPICLEEAQVNMRTRQQLEKQVAGWLEKLPSDATLLMYVGDHVGSVEQAGIPLRHVINEGNHRVWMRSGDPDGLWERALADPAQYCDYVLAFDRDPVWQAVEGRHLKELVEIHVTGQARAILYRAR
jgi:hypothetical protein